MLKHSFMLVLIFWMSMAFAQTHVMKMPADMNWMDGPPTLPAGAQMSVIDGDPNMKGPFVMRLKFPSGYKIPAHWHSKDENITVIEGQLSMGLGDKLDESKMHAMSAGGFAKMPMKVRHYVMVSDQGAIVQLHGMGPFDITYVNPSDDPRKKK